MAISCKSCNSELQKGWKYCPFCGNKRAIFGFSFMKRKKNISREEKMMRDMSQMMKMFGFPGQFKVQIKQGRDHVHNHTHHHRTKQKKTEMDQPEPLVIRKPVKEMVDPETSTRTLGKGIKYVLKLPGVKSTKDISIRKFEESVEIRAYAGEKGYFKVIPTRPRTKIVEKKFQDEMLKIIIG